MDARLTQGTDGVRRFTDASIQKAIDGALSGIEPGAKALVFEANLEGDGVRGVLAVQYPNGWSIGLIGEIDPKMGWSSAKGGISVKKVWR